MRRIHKVLSLAAIAALASAFIAPLAAHADIAPPEQAPGSNINPGGPTRVQMTAERVVIDVLRVRGKGIEDLPIANVTASFTMRNNGTASERLVVRFPLTDPSGQDDGFGGQPEIEQLTVTVDSRRVPIRVVTMPNPQGDDLPPIKWAAFEVTFPPGRDVKIEVNYILQSTGFMPYGRFKYILETGAGWDGPIGSAEFILKLPYEANEENVVLDESTPGGAFENGQVKWVFKNIEPTQQDNFFVTVLAPSVWQRILEARQRTARTPDSAAAWRELAQAYLSAIFIKYGPQTGKQFVPLIEEAYRRAQESDPASAQLRAELAQALLDLNPPIFGLDPAQAEKIFAELKATFERDPRNTLAQKLLTELRGLLTQLAQSGGENARTAQQQLEQLNQIAQQTGADQFAPTPTPAPAATPPPTSMPPAEPPPKAIVTEPVETTSTVSQTTESGAVITTTTISTQTMTMTDTATSQPVVVVIIRESTTVTATTDITGVVPSAVTEVDTATVITTTTGSEAAPAASTVVTATTTTTATATLDESGLAIPEASGLITATTVTTATVEASPLDATQPATTTVIVVATVISPTTPSEAAPAASTVVTATTVTTATTGLAEPGAPPPTVVVTTTTVTTATVEASPLDATQPATTTVIVAQTTISPTVVITRPAQPGEPAAPEVTVTTSTVVTSTTGTAEPGAPPPPTSIITETNVVTTTVEPPPVAGVPPVTTVVTETTVTTATVDATGAITPGIPIIIVVTGTLPSAPPTPSPLLTPTPAAPTPAAPTPAVPTPAVPTPVATTPPLTTTLTLEQAEALVQQARTAAEQQAQNAAAWRELAQALLQRLALEEDKQSPTAQELIQELIEAYEKAQQVEPQAPNWHTDLARALLQIYGAGVAAQTKLDLAARIISELKSALTINPNDAAAAGLLAELRNALSEAAQAQDETGQKAQELLEALQEVEALAATAAPPAPAATETPAAPIGEATATPEAATPAADATATAAAAVVEATPVAPTDATAPVQGIPPAAWLGLLVTYIAGGAAVYGIHSAVIRRDREAGR